MTALENVAIVSSITTNHTTTAATYPSATTAGRTLVLVMAMNDQAAVTDTVTTPSGWTLRARPRDQVGVYTKVASGSETTVTVTHSANTRTVLLLGQLPAGYVYDTSLITGFTVPSTSRSVPAITPTSGADALLYVFDGEQNAYDLAAGPAAYTLVTDAYADVAGSSLWLHAWERAVSPTSGSYSSSISYVSASVGDTAHVAFIVSIPFTADFIVDPSAGVAPLTVEFNDTSHDGTGTPNSWLWDFGDGSTSTSQNPSHVYAVTGSYTVTLTVGTTTAESDSVTKTNVVSVGDVYVPPPPSNAVIEIRAAGIGASRWGVALWGVGLWADAGWVDVTPQSVDATVRWGSHEPERGILAGTEAGTWSIDTYDPDRLLDPGNPDSPYATDLRAGLPIRIRHRGTIVRQGICETIAFFHKDKRGGIRVTDNISTMARTPVPSDSILSDTLRARARDVIAAAGLRVTVEPDPPSGDPALAPRLDGDLSVWRHVADAAEQTLHIPYVDRLGTLKFRAYAAPYDRARFVDGTNLIDLGTIVQTSGLYSVVQVRNLVGEGDDLIERRLTPTPRYGSVTYTRDDATPDSDAWADAVLLDRSLQSVQWIPGDIYPLTADDVEYFATLEAVERLSVIHDDTTPPVAIAGTIIGGEFRVVSKKQSEALWRFSLELAQTGDAPPLFVDGADPPEYLLNETSDAYLYEG